MHQKTFFQSLFFFTLLASSFLFPRPLLAKEGFYKDLFMDGGCYLSSRTSLPAANSLNLSLEYFAGEDYAAQQRIFSQWPGVDDNGVLLFPDGEPRFQAVYVNGGKSTTHGSTLEEIGRERFRAFYENGGSYTGSCAGAFIAARHYNCGMWKNDGDLLQYFHIWPGTMYAVNNVWDYLDIVATVSEGEPGYRFWQLFKNFGGSQDQIVEDVRFAEGPRDMTNTVECSPDAYLVTEYLGQYAGAAPDNDFLNGNYGLIAYKQDDFSGRLVLSGTHPEGILEGEQLAFMKAILAYALEGSGDPRVKAVLENNQLRLMDNNGLADFEKIGDQQYHHFQFSVPEGAGSLVITVDGDGDQNRFNLDLFAQKGDFAFKDSSAVYKSEGAGSDEQLVINNPDPGLWYLSVKEVTAIQNNPGDYTEFYSGPTEILNGVSYSIKADITSAQATATSTLSPTDQLTAILENWFTPAADLNNDGLTNSLDWATKLFDLGL